MKYVIEPRKVACVVVECNNVIKDKQFNHGEVILGLAELLGRIVVDASSTTTQADEMYALAQQHLADTIKVGLAARGSSLIQRV